MHRVKKKKRCRNKPKVGSTNGLCSVHQPKVDDLGANSDDNAAAGPATLEEDVEDDEPHDLPMLLRFLQFPSR